MSKERKPIQVGDRFGRLVIVECVGRSARRVRRWKCLCDCDTEKAVGENNLRNGSTSSCGCLGKENKTLASRTHGGTYTPEYKAWASMKRRCTNPADNSFERYGGRGIAICERWLRSFENFLADMGRKPTPQHSLDRIDCNGNYELANCRWATAKDQARNRRNTIQYAYQGDSMSLPDWCDRLGLDYDLLRQRIDSGWPFERAVATPKRIQKKGLLSSDNSEQSAEFS